MPKAVRLGNFAFSSKSAAVTEAQRILYRSPLGKPLEGDDLAFVIEILSQHERFDEKIAHGFAGIIPLMNYYQGTAPKRGFHVVCPGGGTKPFSYRKALRLEPHKTHAIDAARFAILESVLQYKQTRFGDLTHIPCDATDRPVSYTEAQVDHYPITFSTIFRSFCVEHGTPDTVDLTAPLPTGGHRIDVRFKDPEIAKIFRRFHDARATLRIVCAEVNLRESWRGKQRAAG